MMTYRLKFTDFCKTGSLWGYYILYSYANLFSRARQWSINDPAPVHSLQSCANPSGAASQTVLQSTSLEPTSLCRTCVLLQKRWGNGTGFDRKTSPPWICTFASQHSAHSSVQWDITKVSHMQQTSYPSVGTQSTPAMNSWIHPQPIWQILNNVSVVFFKNQKCQIFTGQDI